MPSHPTTQAAQERTLLEASKRGEAWTSAELDLALADSPCEALAASLHRSLYGVYAVRQAIRSGRPVGGGHGRSDRPEPRTYTFIDGDCPDDW